MTGSGGRIRTEVVVIGAGHSGLAMSRALSPRSIDHVVIERGEVAQAWRTERWDPGAVLVVCASASGLQIVDQLRRSGRRVLLASDRLATGYRPDLGWLEAPVFDRRGDLRHDRGIVDAPGLCVLGLPFLRRRKSSFIHGAEDDVGEIAAHLAGHLERVAGATMQNAATVDVQDATAACSR